MQTLIETETTAALQPGVLRVLRNGKRVYAREFEAWLVRQCRVSGTSMLAIAMVHGVNANLVRRWIVLSGTRGLSAPPTLLPVTLQVSAAAPQALPSQRAAAPELIDIDVHGARVRLHGAVDAQRLWVVLNVLARRT